MKKNVISYFKNFKISSQALISIKNYYLQYVFYDIVFIY